MSVESYKIPFNKPSLVGREIEYIRKTIRNHHTSGDGKFTMKCQELLESILGVSKVYLVTSGTHALEMAALLLDIQRDDEVIFSSFTHVSTVNAFVLRGARPVFIDIRPDTLNIDEKLIEPFIGPKSKAIVLTHYAGIGCEMDYLLDRVNRHGLLLIEDNACGFLAKYKNKYLGTFGCLAAQSFHETKNLHCGEGGALLINDPYYIERAECIRDKGTDRGNFLRGHVDRYTWVDIGSSYVLSDILAAFLLGQLEMRDKVQKKRKQIWERYQNHLKDWATENGVLLPMIPSMCEISYSSFFMILPNPRMREDLISYLKSKGILCVFHYQPLHLSPMGIKFDGKMGDCPVTESVSECLVRLPFYTDLSTADQRWVIDLIKTFRHSKIR